MATVTLKGNPINTAGNLPSAGSAAPDFTLVKTDLSAVSLKDFIGKTVVLSIFPSVDTPTCAMSVRRFNAELDKLGDVAVLCASADLPFAHKRFCGAEGLDRVLSVSDLRDKDFGKRYGVTIIDGPLAGLLARAVVVIGADGKVKHSQLVSEVADEPDYDAAINAAKG
ncbi:MAG: thiol peroxidase [Rhodospirillaceae bacterium]|nr:thiol peroxidase [Rhodospirillales bacterium]